MTYVATHNDLAGRCQATRTIKPAKSGLLRRFYDAVMEARQREADRELGRFLVRSGGHLTDDIEREMTRRMSMSDWTFRG